MRNKNRFLAPAMLALLWTLCGARAGAAESPVKLLGAGSGARKVLRLHPRAGDKQTMTMTMKTAMTMTAGGNAMPSQNIPATVMTMAVEVGSIATNGDIGYKLTYEDATVKAASNTDPAIAEQMKSSLAGLRGMTGEGRETDHGINMGLQMKIPAGADPQLVQIMDQMKDLFSSSSYPFPDEPVGLGAKWEYKTQIKAQGMIIDQTMSYELVSIEGDRLTLRITQTQNAANQKIENPAAPGMKMNLTKLTGACTGNSIFNLSHILPISGTLGGDTETVMSVDTGQQQQTMDMKMNLNVTIESK